MSDDAPADARHVVALAARYLGVLNERRRAAPLTRVARARRGVERTRQWFERKTRELVQDHWDVALFDVLFGSVKAFGIYPALYFAGLTWTIPIAEYLPLNTQLWTAGYLYGRKRMLSRLGQRRYGHGLIEMDAFRDRALRIEPRDARRIHRFTVDGVEHTLRIGRSRAAEWLRRRRGRKREPNVWLQGELRRLSSDTEFLFQANELRSNAYLYEAILIQKILSSEADRGALLERLSPEAPLEAASDRELLAVVGESLVPAYTRVIEQGNSLTEALRERLGSSFSATSLALRWINWSYQRKIYGLLAQQERLAYRLVAELFDGRTIAASAYPGEIRANRAEIESWIGRATRFGDQAKAVGSKQQAQEVGRAGIAQARALGRRVRLARLALRVSASARRAERERAGCD